MKKQGFTLAEVLITLGVIGVVAALSAPALIQNTGSAQIGPKLAKIVSTIEIANENMLVDADANTLKGAKAFYDPNDSESKANGENYINNLSRYMKITYYNEENEATKYYTLITDYNGDKPKTNKFFRANTLAQYLGVTKDGALIGFSYAPGNADKDVLPQKRAVAKVLIDINGKAKPNRYGRDIFLFALTQDGSLHPVGASNWCPASSGGVWPVTSDGGYQWSYGSLDKCNDKEVTTGYSCAGSIYENNLKVIYQ